MIIKIGRMCAQCQPKCYNMSFEIPLTMDEISKKEQKYMKTSNKAQEFAIAGELEEEDI